jgi:uncharacterized protein (TIGR01777 family)
MPLSPPDTTAPVGNPGQTANPFRGLAQQRLLVTGGTGFIGKVLVCQLLDAGHEVTVFTRKPTQAATAFGGRARCIPTLAALQATDAFDAVINLAGAPVVGPRWSAKRQQQLLDSRVGTTQALLRWLDTAQHKPAAWVQASAIGFYGVRDAAEALTESSQAGAGFMSTLCVQWEKAAAAAAVYGVRQVVLRLGVVLGPGGALTPLLLPFRLGFGGRMGSGRQIMSWVHRDDVLQLVARALQDPQMHGTYNAVAPDAISQAEFARCAGQVLHRPVWFHLPQAPIRALLGEMAELFVDGQRVVPARLAAAGYSFRYPSLLSALQNLA